MSTFSSYNFIFGYRPDSFQDHISVEEDKDLIFSIVSVIWKICSCDPLWNLIFGTSLARTTNLHLNTIFRSKKPACPQLTFNKRINIIPPYSFCPNNLSLVNILYKLNSEIECNPKCHLLAISKRHPILKLFFAYLFEIST